MKVVEERKPWHAPIGKKEQRSALQSNGDRALPPEDDYELRKKKREAKQQQAVEEPTQKYDKMACFPSLLPLVHYLAIECVMRLPQESCKVCLFSCSLPVNRMYVFASQFRQLRSFSAVAWPTDMR